jgi:hypothetical protein
VIEDDTPDDIAQRRREFSQRMARWRRDNPGAWPAEKAHAKAVIREELGL